MHEHLPLTRGVHSLDPTTGRSVRLPFVPAEPFVVLGIDDGEQAAGQGNVADFVVRRLWRLDAVGLAPEVAAWRARDPAHLARCVRMVCTLSPDGKPGHQCLRPEKHVGYAEHAVETAPLGRLVRDLRPLACRFRRLRPNLGRPLGYPAPPQRFRKGG
jgi:hypothetical protein